jgi:hypothetical protein
VHKIFAAAACSLFAVACSSEYHPEYHPVTVSNIHQDLAYPVTVNNGTVNNGAAPQPAPVYVVPGQAVAPIPAPYLVQEAPPPDFFAGPRH